MMMMKKFRYRMSVGVLGLAILGSYGCTSSKTTDESAADLAPAAEAGTDAVPMDPATAPPPTADAANPAGTNVAAGTDAPPPSAPVAEEKPAGDMNPTTAPPVADNAPPADKPTTDAAPVAKKTPAKAHHKKHKAAKKPVDVAASESLSDAQADASAAAPKDDLTPPPAAAGDTTPPPSEQNPLANNDVHAEATPSSTPSSPSMNSMGNQAMGNPGNNPLSQDRPLAQNAVVPPPPPPAPPQRTIIPPPPPPAEVDEPFYMKKSVVIATVILAIAGAGSFVFRRKES
jgi:hypothetical protein